MKKYHALHFVQNGKDFYSLVWKTNTLLNEAIVPYYDAESEKGYQRVPKETRVRNASTHIIKGGTFPTSILINYQGELNFSLVEEFKDIGFGILRFNNHDEFHITDGQHRMLALEKALNSGEVELDDFSVPIILTNYSSEIEEMKDFTIVNRMQKSVPTDLTDRLMAKQYREETDLKSLLKAGRSKEFHLLKSIEIAKILGEDKKSIWYDMIRKPNVKMGDNTISERSMTQSLSEFIKATDAISVEDSAQIIINYWAAIHELCPGMDDSHDYPYIWNTTGVYVMNQVMNDVMVKTMGNHSVEGFKDVLRALTRQMNPEFWKKDGPLKGIGGQGGFNKIAAEIKADLVYG